MYLCSLRTITLAVGILFRLHRVVEEERVHEKGSGGNVSDTQPLSPKACLPLTQSQPRGASQVGDPTRAFTMAILQFPIFFKNTFRRLTIVKTSIPSLRNRNLYIIYKVLYKVDLIILLGT